MYNPNLPQYSMGSFLRDRRDGVLDRTQGARDWAKSNAGTIGTVAGGVGGAALGTALAIGTLGVGAAAIPTLMSAGAAAGGKMGGAVQENYEGDIAADEMQTQMTRDNRRQMAYSQYSPDQTMSGLSNFANGGPLNPESTFALFSNTGRGDSTQRYAKNPLTQTSQSLIERNYEDPIGADPVYMKNIKSGSPRQFYVRDQENDISQLVTNRPFESGRKNDMMNFMNSIQNRSNEQSQFQLPADRVEPQLKQRAFGGPLAQGGQSGGGLIEYSGQDHNGPNGGIPVDKMGNPSVVSGQETVGLTENKESTEGGYVFSEKLKPDGKKSFSDLAKELNKRYYG